MYQVVLVALILCILFKVLNVNSSPEKSSFYCSNAKLLDQILKHAPKLAEPYRPTRLWGYSGHIQTVLQGAISRLNCPLVDGKRHFLRMDDGATLTYDLYHPIDRQPPHDDVTLAIAPGIGNSSESIYVRRVVYHAQFSGYRVAVLNHIGTLKCVPVTSPRIFCYGNTSDYAAMIDDVATRYPRTKVVCLGFSMGGNVVTKYLGEDRPRNSQVVAGVSACQGYDITLANEVMLQWGGFRRLYLFVMTENMRAIFRRWQKELFPEELKRRLGINERSMWAAATLPEMDDAYTRKVHGFKSVKDMYRVWSSSSYWENVSVPMAFVNALDDPLVPPVMLEPLKAVVARKSNFLYVEQKYGGHLGFYEGGFVRTNALTWLDRLVVDLASGLTAFAASSSKDVEKLSCSCSCSSSSTDEDETNSSSLSESELEEEEEKTLDGLVDYVIQSTIGLRSRKRPSFLCRRKMVSYSK